MNTDNTTSSQSENPICRLFEKEGFEIRVTSQSGEPWFIAKDVCDCLELSNSRKAIASLDDDEKNTVTISDGIRGNPNHTIINESGLYSLVLRSRKDAAKKFKKWITGEVLPSIRQNGGYIFGRTEEEIAENAAKSALWARDRLDSKREYTVMTDAIKLNAEREGRIATAEEYAREADMLNMIIIGMKSATWRRKLDLEKNKLIRDSMESSRLVQYTELEKFNASLILAKMPFEMRRGTLTTFFKNTKQLSK